MDYIGLDWIRLNQVFSQLTTPNSQFTISNSKQLTTANSNQRQPVTTNDYQHRELIAIAIIMTTVT